MFTSSNYATMLPFTHSPFLSNWSQTYFTNLTLDQHISNNNWFRSMLTMLKDDGKLYVPMLEKSFNKLGKEVDNSIVYDQHYFILKEDIV